MKQLVFDGLPEGTHTWGIRVENGQEIQFRIERGETLGWGNLQDPQGYVDRGQATAIDSDED